MTLQAAEDPESTPLGESAERAARHKFLQLSTSLNTVAGYVWGVIYIGMGRPWAGLIPFLYGVFSSLSLWKFSRSHNLRQFLLSQLTLILILPFALQVALGGYAAASAVSIWALVSPLSALMFSDVKGATPWFAAFLVLAVACGLAEPALAARAELLSSELRAFFYVMNLGGPSTVAFVMLRYFAHGDVNLRRAIAKKDQEIQAERAKRLGSYTLEGLIGVGGMGAVYSARHTLLRRPTAVKVIKGDRAKAATIARFEREVQVTSELNHPNIVAIYDYGRSPEGEFYYAMELLPGMDLDALVERHGPVPVWRTLHILAQVCDALDEAHGRRLIHRDIKPANINLSRLGKRPDVVKVLDFGLVKDLEADAGQPAEHTMAGTPAYLAPEAIRSGAASSEASDLYAVGAVGHFLLTGQLLFTADSLFEMCRKHVHEPPPSASSLVAGVPPELDAVLLRCLAKDPAQRWASAAELAAALRALARDHAYRADEATRWWDSQAGKMEAPVALPVPRQMTIAAEAHRETVL